MLAGNTKRNQKEPVSIEILKSIVDKFAFSENLIELRFVIMCLLGFSGFMRISELLNLKLKDITFVADGAKIFIEKSKVDQLREGNTVFISSTGTRYCPIGWLSNYIRIAKFKDIENDFLFCRLAKCKNGHSTIGRFSISYTTALDNIRKFLPNDVNPRLIGTHSFRSGGASQAANSGVTDRMISKHGRWSDGKSRDRYIKDSHEKRFQVSKILGL